jgi:holo-[acyl-carrier protein] synthase
MRGIGCDLLDIERLRAAVGRRGHPFLQRLFTPAELTYCLRHRDPLPHLAARFAAKEAIVKALGTGFGAHLGFHDIEILNEPSGRPIAHLSPRAAAHFGPGSLLISLSHTATQAMAIAYWL